MKKIFLCISLLLLFCGCGKYNKEDIIKNFKNKINDCNGYLLKGNLEIYRNEDLYTYDIESAYSKKDKFKVSLINQTNNHEQLILKNDDGVYVITPSLNKSFKFQSEWPYNNSQIYLLQPIISDLENDKSVKLKKEKDNYILTFKANYINDKSLTNQKIYLDKNLNLKKVEVIDDNDDVIMRYTINKIDMNYKFSKSYFNLDTYYKDISDKNNSNDDAIDKAKNKDKNNLNDKKDNENNLNQTSKTDISNDVLYPMYVPVDTYLKSQDVLATDAGNRTILTFTGENSFTFVQSPINSSTSGYIQGDPYLIYDTVGVITDNSVSWISQNKEYYLTSDTTNVDELLLVAKSLSVTEIGK